MRPNSRSLSVSQGKGIDSDSAKASAFIESVEHWHGERVELAGRNESYTRLRQESDGVVAVFALPEMTWIPLGTCQRCQPLFIDPSASDRVPS